MTYETRITMKNRFFVLLTAAFVSLFAADDCAAQFAKMSIGDYGIKSIMPESFSAVRGAVWLDVENPMETFTVSEIKGMVYKNNAPLVEGTASDFTVVNGKSRVEISGRAALCAGASLWSILGLVFFEPEEYKVDMSLRITMASGETRVVEKKGLPVTTLLKLK